MITDRYSILVVDDEVEIADKYSRMFTMRGKFSQPVYGGQSAIDELRGRGRFWDVVLLDMNMPGLDGFATLEEIRKHHPEVCVVFFTAFGDVESAVRALHAGAASLVCKGIRFEDLCGAIQTARIKMQELKESQEARIRAEVQNAANQRLFNMALGFSHQIKNRLVPCGINLDELQEQIGDSPDAGRWISRIRQNLDTIFESVNTFYRLSRARQAPVGIVDFRPAVEKGVHIARDLQSGRQANEGRIVLKTQVPNGLLVYSDFESLAEAVSNLVTNSFEAMCTIGGTIEVAACSEQEFVVLSVTDTGPGFPSRMLNEPLGPFQGTREKTNWGVGLWFAKEVAESAGGTLEFGNRNTSAGGCWVRMSFPRVSYDQTKEEGLPGASR